MVTTSGKIPGKDAILLESSIPTPYDLRSRSDNRGIVRAAGDREAGAAKDKGIGRFEF